MSNAFISLILAIGAAISFLATVLPVYSAVRDFFTPSATAGGKKRWIFIASTCLFTIIFGCASYSTFLSSANTSASSSSPAPTVNAATDVAQLPSPTPTATNTPSGVVVTPSPVVPTPTPTPTPYSATEPGFHCDNNGGVWSARPQNIDGVNCPNATGTQLVINTSGTRGYLYFQQLPHNQPFSSNNAVSITGVLGGTASGYATKCVGLAEQDANTGYLVEYCNTGAWFVASISGSGGILNKLDTGTIAAQTTAEISLMLKGDKLSFSIGGNEPNDVIDTKDVAPMQPTEVAIVYDCVGYGASQTIGDSYLLVHDFSYTTLS